MFGFNLVEHNDTNSIRAIDIFVDDTKKNYLRMLCLFENEVTLYGDALTNIRCTHNKSDYDMNRVKDVSYVEDYADKFYMSFFEFENFNDSNGNYTVTDPAYKSVTITSEAGDTCRPINTGYENIDNFVNKYCVVRLDTKEIFSSIKIPFTSEGCDDIFFNVFMFGKDVSEGVEVVNNNVIIIDEETISWEDFDKHPRYFEIVFRTALKMFNDRPVFFILGNDISIDDVIDTAYSIIKNDTGSRMVIIIGQ